MLTRPRLLSQDWILYWDNTLVHTTASVQDGGKGIKTICPLSYLPNIATADYFLSFFHIVKSELADLSLSQDGFKMSPWRVVQTITKDESAFAIQRWMDCCKKYVRIAVTGPKKIPK